MSRKFLNNILLTDKLLLKPDCLFSHSDDDITKALNSKYIKIWYAQFRFTFSFWVEKDFIWTDMTAHTLVLDKAYSLIYITSTYFTFA